MLAEGSSRQRNRHLFPNLFPYNRFKDRHDKVMTIEDTCSDEHWVLDLTNAPLNTASRTNYVLFSG